MTTGTSALTQTTPFPNVLLDEVMPLLKDTEWRLLCVIVRQTIGWKDGGSGRRKTSDWLTQRQLRQRSGRDAEALSRAIAVLLERRLIVVWNEAGQPLNTVHSRRSARGRVYYGLHPTILACIGIAHETELPKSELVNCMTDSQPKTSIPKSESATPQNSGVLSPKANGTKETVAKEIVTKEIVQEIFKLSENQNAAAPDGAIIQGQLRLEADCSAPPDSEINRFIGLYRDQFERRIGDNPPPISKQDIQQLHTMMEKHSFEELDSLLESFFVAEMPHIRRQGYSLRVFISSVNLLQAGRARLPARQPQSANPPEGR